MKYVYQDKPYYNPETEILIPNNYIEGKSFIVGWKVEQKPDEDGYIPTIDEQPTDAPTMRERLEALEMAMLEMLEVIANG